MEAQELFKKVRKIEIKTRGLSKQIFSGEYHSVFKGRGMAFSEVREYQFGDDIRNIDWNVTARFNHPFVKIFEEERELTVMLLIDVSGSNLFGTQGQLKKEIITEIAATLSFSAIQNNDKVGVIFFSDKIEKFIPPKKGSSHILRIIRELIDFKAENTGTNIAEALRYLTNVIKKRATAFLISDFMADNFEKAVQIANHKHDLIAIRVTDKRETEMPNVGLVRMVDAETGKLMWVDTGSSAVRNRLLRYAQQKSKELDTLFSKLGVDMVKVYTGEDYVKPLMNMFRKREARS
ncbi:DUF58 domain-containing protein [Candidatus Sulfidibacterium hydrothermale]|uniref:DUF58 domain-containing protein n=1 Tax=Candidatus Sulfidibacterium hydrothermale TaxID=2875962 RepID=UPI001F0AF665|nr:DUF58 domain-containing protein [Candidatus Sulfidibacterium hydrothermale]UBM63446.1 DUF58 domain-containing protein [Candidatus Sulfidibacterium hydrothermale]